MTWVLSERTIKEVPSEMTCELRAEGLKLTATLRIEDGHPKGQQTQRPWGRNDLRISKEQKGS